MLTGIIMNNIVNNQILNNQNIKVKVRFHYFGLFRCDKLLRGMSRCSSLRNRTDANLSLVGVLSKEF